MSQLLGTSLKGVQSFEQGWRKIPVHTERQVYYLAAMKKGKTNKTPCWEQLKCSPEKKKKCPAWEFQSFDFCWFVNGTICKGEVQKSWEEKMKKCRRCKIFRSSALPLR